MFGELDIKELPLSDPWIRTSVERFLRENDLAPDDLDYYAGIFRGDKMLAGGGFWGDVMKCIAVVPAAREYNLAGKLVSHLRSVGQKRGYDNLFVFTKPENEGVFKSLAFRVIARATQAILLESKPCGLSDYGRALASGRREGIGGGIVINGNPMTRGHRYLIETAAGQVDALHILVVEEDRSEFACRDRLQMIREGVADLQNVIVHAGGKYVISSATFPHYFIKEAGDVAKTQMELDLDIFASHIAPALGISIRFAGSEENDPLTRDYNAAMAAALPARGIEFREIQRLRHAGQDIRASSVRNFIDTFQLQAALDVTPPVTKPFLLAKCTEKLAQAATAALREELDTTPKPGLVDLNDNGAHHDMTYALMRTSIDTLSPYFEQLAKLGMSTADRPIEAVFLPTRDLGIVAEQAMLAATGGVNTHRGAIFALGLCLVAAARLLACGETLSPEKISETVASLALFFERPTDSHGGQVYRKHRIRGALDNARGGYRTLFTAVLPPYEAMLQDGEDRNTARLRTLLLLLSLLDDSNIYHRKGAEVAARVQARAAELYQAYSPAKLDELNAFFIRNHISPGGSADMLALIIFLETIIRK